MAVTLEWVRDNYDANKNRYIDDGAELNAAVYDYVGAKITKEQYLAVKAAYDNQTQLPPYSTPPSLAKGELYDVFYPQSVMQGSPAYTGFRVKNVGGSAGTFKVELYKGATLVTQTSSWNQAAGTTSAEFKLNMTAPSTGTSVAYTLKCMRDGVVDDTETCTIQLTPATTAVTPEWIRDHYDAVNVGGNGNRLIDVEEQKQATFDRINGKITAEQLLAVIDAYDKKMLLPAYPSPPPTNGGIDPVTTPDVRSLEAGKYNIIVTKSGYDTVHAKITVDSGGNVSCDSVTGGACGGTGYPRVVASGTSVKVHMAGAAPPAIAKCTWIATKDTSKVAFISELILAYNHIPDLTFPVLSKEISDGILMYNNLGTPQTLWGC